MKQQPITIISAELPELSFHDNVERTNALRLELLNEGYSIIGVKANGLTAFIVVTKTPHKLIKLAKKYEQSSIYFSDVDRDTYEINVIRPKAKSSLGILKKSDIIEEGRSLKITFIEDGQQHTFVTDL